MTDYYVSFKSQVGIVTNNELIKQLTKKMRLVSPEYFSTKLRKSFSLTGSFNFKIDDKGKY